MDLFEEIVRMRRAGQRGALATIVHTNGSIPSYESSRMLVREDGSIVGTVGGGCVEADVWAAAKEVIRSEQPRKMTFNLNHEASYDAGLICGGTLEIFVERIRPASPSESWTTATHSQTRKDFRWRRRFTFPTRKRLQRSIRTPPRTS
jgi:xanthine dehydrogenase accessory factor